MAVTHPTVIRNAIADLVVSKIDTEGQGTIVFQNDELEALATLKFSETAFGPAGAGIATAADITDDQECKKGFVSNFTVLAGNGDVVFSGSVSSPTGDGDIILSSTSIGEGDTLSISSLTYESPN